MTAKVLVIAATICLASCGGNDVKENNYEPVEVKVKTVSPANGTSSEMYVGTIEAGKTADLSFIGGGTITNIPIKEGMKVGKGQLIAEVDKQIAEDGLKSARSDEAKAQDSYNRYKNMYETKSIPEAQWIEVQKALEQAKIQVSVARKQVSDCRLAAPFAGYVTSKKVQSGQNVSAGMPVATIADIRTVKVSINVPSTDMGQFHQGQRISIVVPELDGRIFPATVSEKGVIADDFTRAYNIKAVINNEDGLLLPGMICSLSGHQTVNDGGEVIIPENTVQIGFDNSHYVWLASNGKAVRRRIETGEVSSKGIIVKSGLSTGEKIITEGAQKVYDGARIKVKSEK